VLAQRSFGLDMRSFVLFGQVTRSPEPLSFTRITGTRRTRRMRSKTASAVVDV
jgi:hypothetical protein